MPKKGTPQYDAWLIAFQAKQKVKVPIALKTPPLPKPPILIKKPQSKEADIKSRLLPTWQCVNCNGTCDIIEECSYPHLLRGKNRVSTPESDDFSEFDLPMSKGDYQIDKDFEED